MQKITPFLWFDGRAEEAINLYTAAFAAGSCKDNTRITSLKRWGAGVPLPENQVMQGSFELCGQTVHAFDAGPHFKLNPSISFYVSCETAEQTDGLWQQLSEGGSVLMPLDKYPWSEKYGWLQDRCGLSWQISLGPATANGQCIIPSLLFTGPYKGKAEEAIRFYLSVFDDSSLEGMLKYQPGEQEPEGTVKHAQFRLNGQTFMAMDSSAAHAFHFNEALSFFVRCDTQEEIDRYWNALTAQGGQESRCGWLKDPFGVSWQIIPPVLGELLSHPDKSKAGKAMQAMMKMKKIIIADLEAAVS